ncbi:helix-turn-helix domain-containing protein [Micromonospora sp. NBC_01796]|uniref:helix-turn-helix domain-containing protein n=1 Tax=Micromonospora sp. NBC_01796 TaxID=2975987 RepID=UPI002DD8923F|nr:helix-turn-helix domain-containing protein [Micromonospora sp. NBC_01796]WSA89197.1 helix-turn-helix domain-containing protein [Micromonospora sp. NBC_01796]
MTDNLAAEARRLRTVEGLSVAQIRARLGIGKDRLYGLLRGVPAPEWTRRPNAKDELRDRAVRLREDGWSVTDIATELGVAKSTAYQWVRHLPLDPDSPQVKERHAGANLLRATKAERRRDAVADQEDALRLRAQQWTGDLNLRELMLVGAIMYWCEGAKNKPHRKQYELAFVNSDPRLVELFLRFVEATGRSRAELRYRLSIHETADVAAAGRWWAERLGIEQALFGAPQIKRHKPKTNRRNTGADYHGCLVVRVPRARELYVWIEGLTAGTVAGVTPAGFTREVASG